MRFVQWQNRPRLSLPESEMTFMQHFATTSLFLLLAGCGDKPADYFPGYAEAEYVRLAAPIGGTLTRLQVQRGDRVARDASAFAL
jgi:HlyD family secretion protein